MTVSWVVLFLLCHLSSAVPGCLQWRYIKYNAEQQESPVVPGCLQCYVKRHTIQQETLAMKAVMDQKLTPDQLIEELGGCGRFQIRLVLLLHLMKTGICWSFITMAIAAKTPKWWCADDVSNYDNTTSRLNDTTVLMESCENANGSKCQQIKFEEGFRTIVSEFGLVCDNAFIPSTIMSIQTAGMFVGNPFSGQIADLIGRKPPLFLSFVILTVSNMTCFFSTSWVMFAVGRFFIGLGGTFFLTVIYNLASEFSLASWRPWITGFPSWPLEASVYALISWLLMDWKYMHLCCAVVSAAGLLSWWLVPESFRWYLSHGRTMAAENVIKGVADVNRHPIPDLKTLTLSNSYVQDDDKKYTFLDLFRSKYVAKITILCSFCWVALGFVTYGLTFGIQALSGNIFLNFFLFYISGIPVKFIVSYMLNKFGRKKTSIMCFALTCIGGAVVGIVQHIDTGYREELTNWFAIVAYMGITGAWGSVQTTTVELYPTVIRNIGFGTLSTIGRVGAVLGPQMVFLDMYLPGVLYFASSGISLVCIIATRFLPETTGENLPDKITKKVVNTESLPAGLVLVTHM